VRGVSILHIRPHTAVGGKRRGQVMRFTGADVVVRKLLKVQCHGPRRRLRRRLHRYFQNLSRKACGRPLLLLASEPAHIGLKVTIKHQLVRAACTRVVSANLPHDFGSVATLLSDGETGVPIFP
jgi:hypothetical protein